MYLENQSLAQILNLGTELYWHDPVLHVEIILEAVNLNKLLCNFFYRDMRISHEYLAHKLDYED